MSARGLNSRILGSDVPEGRSWCIYCAGHGTRVEDLDVINRMTRTLDCWACGGKGHLHQCYAPVRGSLNQGDEMTAIPVWLYKKRSDPHTGTVLRFGSRRPLRVVLTILRGGGLPLTILFGLGKAGVQWGPADGVDAGHAGMPKGSKYRLFEFRGGRALGVSWDGSDA